MVALRLRRAASPWQRFCKWVGPRSGQDREDS